MAKSKKLEGSDLEKETLLLDVEELEQKTSRERATKIATSRRLAQAWIFALDISYGMYGTLSSYFLTEIIYGTDDDEKAVGLSTYYMIVWCSCNFLTAPVLGSVTDLAGRRPILLIGALTDTLAFPFMAAARTPTAVLLGAACIGTLDCTYNVCKSIIVDAVVAAKRNGARGSKDFCEDLDFGGPRDWWPSRLLYGHAFKGGASSVDLPLLLTRELSVLNVYSIFGLLLGVWLGETLMLSIGVRLAFACVGVVLLPADLWLAYALPESLEDAPPARRCCGVPSRATTKNVLNPMTSLRFLCGNSHRVRALVCTYFVGNLGLYGVSSIILYWLEDHFKFGSVQITSMYFNSIIVGPVVSLFIVSYAVPVVGYCRSYACAFAVGTAGAALVATLQRATAAETWLLFVLVNVFCVAFAPLPLLVGSIAAEVPYEEQGRIQGAVYSLSTGATVIGSIAFLQVYDAANGATVVAIIAGLFGLCAALCACTRDRSPEDGPVLGADQTK